MTWFFIILISKQELSIKKCLSAKSIKFRKRIAIKYKLRLGIFLGFYKVPMGKRVGAKVLLLA